MAIDEPDDELSDDANRNDSYGRIRAHQGASGRIGAHRGASGIVEVPPAACFGPEEFDAVAEGTALGCSEDAHGG